MSGRDELHLRAVAYRAAASALTELAGVRDQDLEQARDLLLGLLWRVWRGQEVDDDGFDWARRPGGDHGDG